MQLFCLFFIEGKLAFVLDNRDLPSDFIFLIGERKQCIIRSPWRLGLNSEKILWQNSRLQVSHVQLPKHYVYGRALGLDYFHIRAEDYQWWIVVYQATTTLISMAIWVRIPDLPIDFYDNEISRRIGNQNGELLCTDSHTTDNMRG